MLKHRSEACITLGLTIGSIRRRRPSLCQVCLAQQWADNVLTQMAVGSPPRWLDREMPFTVPQDSSSIVFVDQNGYRMKSMPLVPLIKAVEFMPQTQGRSDRDVHWPSVDFVTDRSNLRKLMRWIDGYAGRAFRIDAQLAGNGTVLLSRWETRTREQGRPTSYGFNFEEASTTPAAGCVGTTSHHRIVKYVSLTELLYRDIADCSIRQNFGGLSMIVRFEVDAFIPPVASPVTRQGYRFPRQTRSPGAINDVLPGRALATVVSRSEESADHSARWCHGATVVTYRGQIFFAKERHQTKMGRNISSALPFPDALAV